MAKLGFSGLDDVIEEMNRRQERTGETARRMVKAGAQVIADYRKQEAEHRGIRRSGAMIKGIKPVGRIKEDLGVLKLPVYSQGTDENGTRNAEKEFLEHYGYRGRPGSHWIDTAETKGEAPAQDAMAKIWDEAMEG